MKRKNQQGTLLKFRFYILHRSNKKQQPNKGTKKGKEESARTHPKKITVSKTDNRYQVHFCNASISNLQIIFGRENQEEEEDSEKTPPLTFV
jgi:hypothetical protein